jgi:polyhydroxyalkanoate synthase
MSGNSDNPPAGQVTLHDLADTSARFTQTALELWVRQLQRGNDAVDDPLRVGEATMALSRALMNNPHELARVQLEVWADYLALGTRLLAGADREPVVTPAQDDRRFRDGAWSESALFDFIKQGYLIAGKGIMQLVREAPELDEGERARLAFATEQVIDALAPTNFALTNPQALRQAIESGGRSLLDGVNYFLEDISTKGQLDAPMSEQTHFEIGRDLAVTPGQVVYQNDLMQLIQYEATTNEVNRRPLLVVPPWMNKYYILDLRPGNSLIEWLVDQGHTVFVISWINPGASLAHKDFEDYLLEGPIAAIDAIKDATGESDVNVIGYCLGGILIAAAMAWLTARDQARIHSATLLTTMVDFGDTGEVSLFINEASIERLEARITEQGYLDGQSVYDTFRTMRANDLVWSFYVNNYLLGNRPGAFDLLYWNSDSTNMPAAMHTFFIRNMYLRNLLRVPGALSFDGTPIDVTSVKTPTYVLSTVDDHIAPWKTAYQTTQLFCGPVTFVLGESGHIAGVVNPPVKIKYGYRLNESNPPDADDWLAKSEHHTGSWWPHWSRWINRRCNGKVAARKPGDGKLSCIEPAPGSYVLERHAD